MGLKKCAEHLNKSRTKRAPFADTTLVRVPKPRFGSKYAGVLRSPQIKNVLWTPQSCVLTHSLFWEKQKRKRKQYVKDCRALAHTLLEKEKTSQKQLMEVPVEPQCQTKQEDKEHEEGKGGAVLVERWYIADLDGLGAGCLHLDGVGVLDNAVTPSGVPLMHQQGINPARCGSWTDASFC